MRRAVAGFEHLGKIRFHLGESQSAAIDALKAYSLAPALTLATNSPEYPAPGRSWSGRTIRVNAISPHDRRTRGVQTANCQNLQNGPAEGIWQVKACFT